MKPWKTSPAMYEPRNVRLTLRLDLQWPGYGPFLPQGSRENRKTSSDTAKPPSEAIPLRKDTPTSGCADVEPHGPRSAFQASGAKACGPRPLSACPGASSRFSSVDGIRRHRTTSSRVPYKGGAGSPQGLLPGATRPAKPQKDPLTPRSPLKPLDHRAAGQR